MFSPRLPPAHSLQGTPSSIVTVSLLGWNKLYVQGQSTWEQHLCIRLTSNEIKALDKSGNILRVLYARLWGNESAVPWFHVRLMYRAGLGISIRKWQRFGLVYWWDVLCGVGVLHTNSPEPRREWIVPVSCKCHNSLATCTCCAAGFFPNGNQGNLGTREPSKQPPSPGTEAKVQCCGWALRLLSICIFDLLVGRLSNSSG